MKFKLLLFTVLIAGVMNTVSAQKVVTKSGNLKPIKGQKVVNVAFDWSEITIGKKNMTEDEYIKYKTDQKNEKEAGTGDDFEEKWTADKEKFYYPKFIELLNEGVDAYNMTFKEGAEAEYTLTVKVKHFDEGWNIGISKRPAYVDFDFIWTNKAGKTICKQEIYNAVGSQVMGFDFDVPSRVKESFAVAGKRMGKDLRKQFK